MVLMVWLFDVAWIWTQKRNASGFWRFGVGCEPDAGWLGFLRNYLLLGFELRR